MKLKSLYSKPIDRDIKGVIKVGQNDQENVFQELDEYVVTKELAKYFSKFFEVYQNGILRNTDKMGVWISGFFGSGKSHFLKILSYLLENKEVDGKNALDYFDETKIKDSMVVANMKRAANVSTDVILFNIDSKSDYESKDNKEAIVRVFFKVFYEMQGFFGSKPWIAEMERQLSREGLYEEFKTAIKESTGDAWENRRNRVLFDRDKVVDALVKVRGMSKESTLEWFNNKDNNVAISVENFAKMVNEYIQEKGNDHHVVFLVDEIGQYIGDDSKLMLNLQTVVEDLGVYCKGKVWVIVTSQEDIDSITKMSSMKGKDFSKITGRFDTRLSLSSANVDEVIKKRLLTKTQTAKDTLGLLYDDASAKLRNTISFAAGADMINYNSKEDFIDVYPFVPYQFKLLQYVFTGIRQHGSSGKHLAHGERSLIAAFQHAAKQYADKEIGAIVPFNLFYNSMEEFLDGSVKRVIEHAKENTKLSFPEDIEVLKLLFMIKYVKEMPANLENIATLMVTKIDEDKLALKETLKKSLARLVDQTLVNKNGDIYDFLTDDEQDINREIKNVQIDPESLISKVLEVVFEDEKIYGGVSKYRYLKYDFGFNQQIDDKYRGKQDNELTIKIITPRYDGYYDFKEQDYNLLSITTDGAVLKLTQDDDFLDEIEAAMKIETYRTKNASIKLPEHIRRIIDSKTDEVKNRKERATSLLINSIVDADVFINGQKVDIKGRTPKDKIDAAFKMLVDIKYTKLNYIKKFITSNHEIMDILTSREKILEVLDGEPNKLAIDEARAYIISCSDRNLKMTMKTILDRFKAKPYGWKEIDIAGIVASLLKMQEIKLQYGAEYLDITDKEIPNYLTKRTEVEKVVIIKRIQIPPDLILKVRNLGRDLFNRPALSQDEDGLNDSMKELIKDQINKVNTLLAKYDNNIYPGQSTLQNTKVLFKELVDIKDSHDFFNALISKEAELKELMKEVNKIDGFFKNQKTHFDKGLRVLEVYRDNESYVLDQDINTWVAEIRTIVKDPNPYGHIMKLPNLVESFNNRFTELLEEKCKPIKEAINKDFETVKEEISKHQLSEAFKSSIYRPFDKLFEDISKVNNFYKAIAMQTQSGVLKIDSFNKIEKEITPPAPPDPPTGGGTPDTGTAEPPKKFTQHVNMTEIVNHAPIMKTEEDVDAFIKGLEEKLKKFIKENKNIRLVQ